MVEQQILEEKFDPEAVIFLPAHTKLEDAFGPQEEWILEIGENRLLLNPLNGYWLFEDRSHDGWKFTGFRAGDVLFYLEDGELSVKLSPRPPARGDERRFTVAEQLHQSLQKQLEAGIIDLPTFTRKIEALRFQDRNGVWWQLHHPGGNWLTWNGTAWAEGNPAREMQPDAAGEDRRRFLDLKENFFILLQQKEEGKLNPQEFQQAVHDLRTQDQNSTWWQLTEDGNWLKWDGTAWLKGEPDL